MASEWIAVQDPTSGRTYYANMVTKATMWEPPPGYVGGSVPTAQYTGPSSTNLLGQSSASLSAQPYGPNGVPNGYGQSSTSIGASGTNLYGQSGVSLYGPSQSVINTGNPNSSKWRQASDDASGRDYWYHVDTKETTWYMPPELQGQQQNTGQPPQTQSARRLSAQMAIMNMGASETQFQTQAWEDSDEDPDDDSDSSWGDQKQGDEDESESDSDDNLPTHNPNAAPEYNGPTNVIEVSDTDSDDEDDAPAAIFGDDDGNLIATEEENTKYFQIGSQMSEAYQMIRYAEQHFAKHKKSLLKSASHQEMLQWQSRPISKGLRKMDKKLDADALQTFRNITAYMGDRKSGKDPKGHVDKLLRFALKSPEEFRDEIYCQISKQTTNNPKQGSLLKGWELMALCCCTFPPSEEFCSYLATHLYMHTQESSEVGAWANYSLEALDRTMAVGQRREQPTEAEIAKIILRAPIPVRVQMLDKSFKMIQVNCQSRAKDLTQTLGLALKLNHPESFGLFEMEFPEPGWDITQYEARNQMDRQTKINDLVNLPSDRELEMNDRVLDVVASWSRSKRKKTRDFQLVFKCKIHSKVQENSYARQGWKLSFQSCIYHVVNGLYPCERDQALHLAALQLQGINGPREDSFYIPGLIINQVQNFLPAEILQTMPPNEAEQMILEEHVMFKNLDKQDAFRKYIELLRENDNTNKYMGNVFFRCVRVSRLKRQQENMIDDVVLGVSENGIVFLDPLSKQIIDRYKMEEILTYGFRNNAFLFVAGTLMTQKKFHFSTMLGKQMNDLLRAHIDLRVQQAELQGYNVMA